MHNLENIVFWLALAVIIGAPAVWAWWMLAVVAERPAPRKAQEWGPQDFWPGNWGKR